MSTRYLTVALMASTFAFANLSHAQTLPFGGNLSAGPGERSTAVKSSKSNTSDRMGGGGGAKGAAGVTSDRMGGGGGAKGAAGVSSDRMGGGGGGKGAVR
ncbi:hypothetical protein [Bradyrhizobium sp.]|uniref:hypothetical protein n=1 Tax=Bradyrhizobium sp. TaxID=376 RepID=UPI002E179321